MKTFLLLSLAFTQYGTFAVGSKESQDNERGLIQAGWVYVPGPGGGWKSPQSSSQAQQTQFG